MKLVPYNESSTEEIEKTWDWQTVLEETQAALKLRRCKMCNSNIFVSSNQTIWVRYNAYSSVSCPKQSLVETAHECERTGRSIRIQLDDQRSFDFDLRCLTFDPNGGNTRQMTRIGHNLCRSLPTSRIYNCPQVTITREEFKVVQKKHPNRANLLFSDGATEVNVCTELYILSHGNRLQLAVLLLFFTVAASHITGNM